MSIITASVAQINIGYITIEGLMSETGEFGVAVPQVSQQFSFPNKNASRTIKPLLGKDSPFLKWRTPLNSKPVNVILIQDFERLMFELALKGNEGAINMSRMLIGLSLQQLFNDAFDIKFEKEERQQWLAHRQKTKFDFRWVTDLLKDYGFTEGSEYAAYIKRFQDKCGVKSGTRDALSLEKLITLESCQTQLATMMGMGLSPYEALDRLRVR